MTSRCVVNWRAWNGPLVVLGTGAVVGLSAEVDSKSWSGSPLVVMVMCVSFIVMLTEHSCVSTAAVDRSSTCVMFVLLDNGTHQAKIDPCLKGRRLAG